MESKAGIIIALAAAGLLLALLFFRSSPRTDLPQEQNSMSVALVGQMMTNGVLVNYDCAENVAWVNRPVWDKYNADQKRNMTIALATACTTQNAPYKISVLDFETKRELAGFDGHTLR